MNLQKHFILLFLFATFQICFGQEKPKAELIDEFGKVECEDFWARFDSFFYQLQNDPSSSGYVIIYGEDNSLPATLRYEKLTDGIVRFRNYDRDRLIIIRAEEKDSFRIQFWIIPAGAEKPIVTEKNWNLKVKQNTPFILWGFSEGDGFCPTDTSVTLFVDYLKANPNMRAHIVITDKGAKNFENTKKNLLSQLINKYKIHPNRLKFFYVKDKNFSYKSSNIEYWLVPQKKK